MMPIHVTRALLIASTTLLATGAYAESKSANPHAQANAAEPPKAAADAPKSGDKSGDKAGEKPADKAKSDTGKDAKDGKIDGPSTAKGAADRDVRKAKEHEVQRQKLMATLKGPPDEALRQELRRDAERLARLERIRALATDAKDKDAVDKATMLIAKENDRHEDWMKKHAAGAPAAAGVDTKGGAK